MNDLVKKYNAIYGDLGFDGIIKEMQHTLEYGNVAEYPNEIYRISTGGWSDDEEKLYALISLPSIFGYKHYIGRLRGGHFYFVRHRGYKSFEIVQDGD